ncbi:hypothetical protein NQZ68_034938 [Dissostichus eleginoides]|nr:hypothetical protein NQZ68_034938 [Dissostichus eleginoides]
MEDFSAGTMSWTCGACGTSESDMVMRDSGEKESGGRGYGGVSERRLEMKRTWVMEGREVTIAVMS